MNSQSVCRPGLVAGAAVAGAGEAWGDGSKNSLLCSLRSPAQAGYWTRSPAVVVGARGEARAHLMQTTAAKGER